MKDDSLLSHVDSWISIYDTYYDAKENVSIMMLNWNLCQVKFKHRVDVSIYYDNDLDKYIAKFFEVF